MFYFSAGSRAAPLQEALEDPRRQKKGLRQTGEATGSHGPEIPGFVAKIKAQTYSN